MASEKSYTITISNNKTEKEGIKLITECDNRFIEVDNVVKKSIMNTLGIEKRFARSFDLIYINNPRYNNGQVLIDDIEKITLVELKTTQKKLVNLPSGFFFGATENEFDLAKKLGSKYKFCFVSLHRESRNYCLLSYDELQSRIKNKRIQYQINL